MKKIIGLIWIIGFVFLGVIIPNMVSKGADIPVDVISIVAIILVAISVVIGFIGGNNNDDE